MSKSPAPQSVPFFARRALLVLLIVVFFVPFALRGARMSLQNMKNDIKDWLPSDFPETTELDWFRDQFLGEQFVLVSWDNCTLDDADGSIEKFSKLLIPDEPRASDEVREVSVKYGLYTLDDLKENWGGRNEKWLCGKTEGSTNQWYFVVMNEEEEHAELYRWRGAQTLLGAIQRGWRSRFGGGNIAEGDLVATLPPEYYDDPTRLDAPLFASVTAGPAVLAQMIREDGPIRQGANADVSEEEAREIAMERLSGTLIGRDGNQTCLIVYLTPTAKHNLARVLGRGMPGQPRGELLKYAEEIGINPPPSPPLLALPSLGLGAVPEPPAPRLRLGGPPVDNIAIDEEGQITLVRLVGLCFVLGVGLSYVCFRSFKITIMLFFVGGVSAIASLSFVFWLGGSVDAVLMSMPAVVYVLGLSGAVHIVNYYRDAAHEHGLLGAPDRAVAHGWKPCTLAAITTAIGLASLCTSSIKPIFKFGAFSALGVLATLILLFTYLPSALTLWPSIREKDLGAAPKKKRFAWFTNFTNGLGERTAEFIIHRNGIVAVTCTIVLILFAGGLYHINTSIHLVKMFDASANIIKDYTWLEQKQGKLVPMEVVLRFDQGTLRLIDGEIEEATEEDNDPRFQYSFLERIEASDRVHQFIEEELGAHGRRVVGRGLSAATFCPELPSSGSSFRAAAVRGGYNRRLAAHREEFVEADYLRTDKKDDSELWRVSLRLGALQEIDYGAFVAELKSVVEPVMAAYRYRDDILHRIDETTESGSWRGASVLLVGAPYSAYRELAQQRKEAEKEQTEGGVDVEEFNEDHVVDQTRLFAITLKDLLRNAGCRLSYHDPDAHTGEELQKKLSATDYVVYVKDAEVYDLDALAADFEQKLIDVREHAIDPDNLPQVDYRASPHEDEEWAGPQIAAIYTGVVPVVYKAQRTLLHSLIESIGWAFVMIAFVMMFVLRSPKAGLISMFPNVFPVVVIFGAMGWLGINVDIGSMMTASVAMGVAVDDTIHFLTWYRWGLDEGRSRKEAIMLAYRRVARAMAQTTAIGGLGLAIFALSTFSPTQRFGYLMLTLLAAALVGDLIFLPALLAGPFGRVFSGESKDAEKDVPPEPSTDAVGEETEASENAGATLLTGVKGEPPPDSPLTADDRSIIDPVDAPSSTPAGPHSTTTGPRGLDRRAV